MKELREEVKWYLSFSDEEVFQGVALPKKEEDQSPETLPTNVPKTPCAPESGTERRGPKFLGWENVLYPSRPVVAAGEISKPSKASKPRVGPIQLPQTVPVKPPASLSKTPTPSKPSSPVQALAVVQPSTLPHGFARVTACLRMPKPLEMASEMPHGTMAIGVVVTPRISTMSMSHIIRMMQLVLHIWTWSLHPLGGWPLVVQAQKPHPRALQSNMSLAMNRQLADNCHWADNWLLPASEQMNIPNYHY